MAVSLYRASELQSCQVRCWYRTNLFILLGWRTAERRAIEIRLFSLAKPGYLWMQRLDIYTVNFLLQIDAEASQLVIYREPCLQWVIPPCHVQREVQVWSALHQGHLPTGNHIQTALQIHLARLQSWQGNLAWTNPKKLAKAQAATLNRNTEMMYDDTKCIVMFETVSLDIKLFSLIIRLISRVRYWKVLEIVLCDETYEAELADNLST